jgi:anthranilate phosphoribosyltransferase
MLDMDQVCFVCSGDRYDEVILGEPTDVFEFRKGENERSYQVDHTTFGYPMINMDEIGGDTPEQNAEIMQKLLTGRKTSAVFYVTAANAAMALQAAGFDRDIKICLQAAEEAILSGRAMKKVQQLKEFV